METFIETEDFKRLNVGFALDEGRYWTLKTNGNVCFVGQFYCK